MTPIMRGVLSIPGLLILTGITSVVVLAVPQIILFGFLALILPGFFMSLAPTLFLYLLIFWFCSLALSGLGRGFAAVAGIAVCAALGWGVPPLLNAPTDRTIAAAKARDTAGSGRIPMVATVALLQPPMGQSDESLCDELCVTLLYSGTAKTVAMGASQAPPQGWRNIDNRSGAYRIERRKTCPDVKFGGVNWTGENSGSANASAQVFEAARQRMAQGECLIAVFDETIRPDLTIRRLTAGDANPASLLSPVPGPVQSNLVEIVRGDRIIARGGDYFAARLTSPLMILPYGSGMSFTGWEFSRRGRHAQKLDAIALIRRFTGWALTPPAPDAAVTRTLIEAALTDSSRSADDSAFGLIDTYSTAITLRKSPATEADTRLYTRIIADPRITKFWHLPIWKLPMTDATLRDNLKEAILTRMLAERDNREIYKALSNYLEALPPDTFAEADPLYDKVLADPVLGSLGSVNVRLADRGSEMVDELVRRVAEDKREPGNGYGDMEMRTGALRALCRLGPKAADARDRLEGLANDGTISVRTKESALWRTTMVALGDPVTRYVFPPNMTGNLDNYHRRLVREASEGCRRTG